MVKPVYFMLITAQLAIGATVLAGPVESDYYRLIDVSLSHAKGSDSRDANWKPTLTKDHIPVLEISGIEVVDGDRLAICTRQGDVWFVDGAYADPPKDLRFTKFATALHEPMGLMRQGQWLYSMQRTELTRMRDSTSGDSTAAGIADEYLTVAKGWNVSGNYHEFAFGPKLDKDGNLWLALNVGIGNKSDNDKPWRGWAMTVSPTGELEPACAGLRSPCALGTNATGDMFLGDQQGHWVPATPIYHLRKGKFFGNAETLKTLDAPGSPVHLTVPITKDIPYPVAVKKNPELTPPAVWLPYSEICQSATDIACDMAGDKFGPFEGQLFVSDFTTASLSRVFLEKVNGEYQGACFPFRQGFACGIVRMVFGRDGSLFAGMTNRGWSSRGSASYGLQRLIWTGKMPFEISQMKAKPDGFELVFTKPADLATANDPASYSGTSHTFNYTDKYGSPVIDTVPLTIKSAKVAEDRLSVRLVVDGRRQFYVHELHATGVRSGGEPLLHSAGFYTLNQLPR